MSSRVLPGWMVACMAVLAGCSAGSSSEGGGGQATVVTDPAAFTVSYRNDVRLPWSGAPLTAERFASQVRSSDPVASIRCGAEDTQAYEDLTSFLGGIEWSHPISIIKDASLPPLYQGKQAFGSNERAPNAAAGGASDASAGPTIERPDLVGVRNGIAIFLSKVHGLIAVDARGATPVPSCSMKLPGKPMSFFFKNDELVVLVNAFGGFNRSALIRYTFRDGKFGFVDSVQLPNQTIKDARVFDSTIVAYTDWTKDRPAPQIPEPNVGSGPNGGGTYPAGTISSNGGGGAAERSSGASMADPSYGGYNANRLGAKVIVVNWDDKLNIDWEDSLLDDPVENDPMIGRDPNEKLTKGQVVYSSKTWQSFATASDRYLAIPRAAHRTVFREYASYQYSVCTQYNPQHHQINQCSVKYEQRPNPDYKAPNPSTGDYSCNGQKLADCIKEAAPVVSQYVYVPVGQSCQLVWQGQCEKSEMRTATYPQFDYEDETELVIYRFEAGVFTKLDGQLAKMSVKNDALAFEYNPLAVKGTISNRNQVQFQNGHLYVFSDNALQTLSVAGNSIAYVNRLDVVSTTYNPAVLFSPDRAMISSFRGGYPTGESSVEMIDLTEPAIPAERSTFTMPGNSSQLMLASGGILGPGTVSFDNAQVHRSLQKVTLFDKSNGGELDNLLLGTEYDTFESSWFAAEDDQRIRLGSNGQRMFLPYSGRHHADQYEPTAHRLNVSRIENGRLVSERSFNVEDEIIRTAAVDDARSLVFGDSATYLIDHTSGDWALSTLREMFVPFATYRIGDQGDIHARIDRVGSKCRISTFSGPGGIFGEQHLAQIDIPCAEGTLPIGFSTSLLWAGTLTGVTISPDGKKIDVLDRGAVEGFIAKIPKQEYCFVDDAKGTAGMIDYLDEVPARIVCQKVQ